MAFQTSETLLELVYFLTRPLTKVYPVLTVMSHQRVLQKQLQSAFFSNPTASTPFTLIISPTMLPPTPIYAACLMSGVQWVEWIRLLAPQGMCVFVMEGVIKANTAKGSDLTTVWSKDDSSISSAPILTSHKEGSSQQSSSLSQLQSALKSVQSRTASTKPTSKPQTVANKVVGAGRRASLRTSFHPKPTRLSQVITASDEDDEGSDSDSNSDAGSTTSSSSSLFSAASSSGSATTVASSDCVSSCDFPAPPELNLDLLRAAIKSRLTIQKTDKAFSISQRPARGQSRGNQPQECRLVDPTKTGVTRYNYKGGQTAVMTGGVMLGAVCSRQRC